MVLGCVLLAADAFLAIYFILWFGIGAVVTGLAVGIFPSMPFSVQIVLWGALSALLLLQWLLWLRPRFEGKRAAEAKKQLPGQAGVVVSFSNGSGVLRLQRPVGGRDVWEFSSDAERNPGDRVVIESIAKDGKAVAKEN